MQKEKGNVYGAKRTKQYDMCLISTHDGANAKLSTNWDEMDYSELSCYSLRICSLKDCLAVGNLLRHIHIYIIYATPHGNDNNMERETSTD
jgi:hypothetical protein